MIKKYILVVSLLFALSVNALNAQTPSPTGGKFNINDRAKVNAANLNVRPSPGSTTSLGIVTYGTLGTIVGGPTTNGGIIWWQINYDSGLSGWSQEGSGSIEYLVIMTASASPTPTPQTSTTTSSSASFLLSFTPSSASIAQGAKTNTSVNITGTAGPYKYVTLAVSQGLPAGLTVSFSPESCIPPCNSIMTVSASQAAPTGTYLVPIIGAAVGMTATSQYSITVVALPKFDYSISLTENQGSIATGEKKSTTINLDQISGTSEAVNLSASGLPNGVTAQFSNSNCYPPCSSAVTFSVSNVTSGTYPITLSATSGSLTRKVTYYLQINPSSLFDYSINIFPASTTIFQKDSISALINISQLAGTSQYVTLTIANYPASTTISTAPTSCKPPCSAVLNVSTKDKINPGTYPITILGYSSGITKSTDFYLNVLGNTTQTDSIWKTLPPYVFVKNLTRGSRSADVTRLQQYLAASPDLYPEGNASGFFGTLTAKAVARFQLKYGVVSGIGAPGYGAFGPKTRAKMNELLAR